MTTGQQHAQPVRAKRYPRWWGTSAIERGRECDRAVGGGGGREEGKFSRFTEKSFEKAGEGEGVGRGMEGETGGNEKKLIEY